MRLINKINESLGKYWLPLTYYKDQNEKEVLYKIGKAKFKIRVNTQDKFVVWEIFKFREYFDKDFEIESKDCVVDIGANIGAFSIYAAQKATRGKVYAYEPINGNYQQINKNKKLNNLKNLFVFKKAVSNKKGFIKLKISDTNSGGHSMYDAIYSREEKVRSISLTEIVESLGKIDFLKIDTEGSEYNIILSTSPKILRKIKKISLEYHDYFEHKFSYKHLVSHLEKSGFKVEVSVNLIMKILKLGQLKAINKSF